MPRPQPNTRSLGTLQLPHATPPPPHPRRALRAFTLTFSSLVLTLLVSASRPLRASGYHSTIHTREYTLAYSRARPGQTHGGGSAGGVIGGLLAMESPSGLKHNRVSPVTKRLLLQFPVHVIRKRHVDVGAYEA